MSKAVRSATERCRVFVSATSLDLRSARLTVCDVLEESGHEPRFQERFDHGYRCLEEFLKDRISECQAVICLAGRAFGAKPEGEDAVPRSYTQLEYDVARELGLPVFVFLASYDFPADAHPSEPADLAALQSAHVESLRRSHKWAEFESIDELRGHIATLADQLPRILPLALFEHHRPPPPMYFAGRAQELEQLAAAIRSPVPALVAVVGMGGQGKTALVDRWLREQPRLDWTRGAWISLDRAEISFDRFLDLVLGFLLGTEYDKREMPDPAVRSAELIRLLQAEPILLVLDAVERWLTGWTAASKDDAESTDTVEMRRGQTELVDEFLRQAAALSSGSHVVLTTRALPAALDDVACTIIPVQDESQLDAALEGLDVEAAVQLLRRLGVRGTPEELATAASAYQAHPLALTVLAGLLRKLYGGRLERIPEVNPLNPRRSLHTLLESTLHHLPSAQRAEQFLAVAAHALEDPPLGAVAAALPGDDVEELRTLAVTLADWSVIRWDGADQVVRMHPLVKQFAASRVGEEASRTVHMRYSDWYEGLSLPASPTSLEQVAPRLMAVEHALRAGSPERCTDLLFSTVHGDKHLIEWSQAFGHHSAMIDLLGRVAQAALPERRPSVLIPRAALERQLGRLEKALADLDEALAILPRNHARVPATDVADLAGALINRGNVLRQLSRPHEALETFEQALTVLERLPEGAPVRSAHLPAALMNRGLALRETGRFTEAAAECERGVRAYRVSVQAGQRGLLPALSRALTNHGITLMELNRTDEALSLFEEALEIQARLEKGPLQADVEGLAQVKISKAAALSESGSQAPAIAILDDVIEVLEPLVDGGRADLTSLLALATLGRAQAFMRTEEYRRSIEDGGRAIQLYEDLIASGRVDLDSWLAYALLTQAEAGYRSGAFREAATARGRGLKLLEERIAAGEPETRVLYLRKSAEAARYLAEDAADEGRAILERAVRELETGLAAGETVEALRLETQRAVRVLEGNRQGLYEPMLVRLRLCGL